VFKEIDRSKGFVWNCLQSALTPVMIDNTKIRYVKGLV